MLTINWKKYALGGGLILAMIGSVGASTVLAHGNEAAVIEALGIEEATYDEAEDAADAAIVLQAAEDGWITDDEADELIDAGRGLRLGRNQYYKGIYDEDAFVAEALGISLAQWEAAEEEAYEARVAEKVAEGDLTAEEAADKMAVREFKASLDKDAFLADALGISLGQLEAYRDAATSWDDVLTDLGLTEDEVREGQQAAMEQAIANAVADGTLTEEQAEDVNSRNGRGRRGGNRRGGRGGTIEPAPAETTDANA